MKNNLQTIQTKYNVLKNNVVGNIMSISGFSMGLFCLIALMIVGPGVIAELINTHQSEQLSLLLGYGLFFMFGVGLSIGGGRLKGRIRRFKRYCAVIGSQSIISLLDLAEVIHKSPAYVSKDINKMLDKNLFNDAYLDRKNNRLIFGHYNYRSLLNKEEEAEQLAFAKQKKTGNSEIDQLVAEGSDYLEQIKEIGLSIKRQTVIISISRLVDIGGKIFNFVAENPQKSAEIRQFMHYYLPTTLKLLQGYGKFEAQNLMGNNITAAMQEIERMLDIIVVAFEKLLDDLFQDETLDISTDITVLENMLAQEGLTGQDFKL